MTQPASSDWIRAYAQVQVATDREILGILRDAQQRLDVDMQRIVASDRVSDQVRYQQMAIMRQAILREQSAVLRNLGRVVEARRLEAAARAIQLGDGMDIYILNRLGQGRRASELTASLSRGLARTTQVAMARLELSYTALSQRIYNTDVWLGSRIDRQITVALARGLTAREFAPEARDWFNPNTPGGVRYAAMRLARSEINNAFHAVSVQQVQDKPWVNAMRWRLSSSHPRSDVCDEYAHEDKFQMGPGVFPKREVPRKPHPQCFCYVTPEQIDEDEFLDQLTSGKFDDYLARRRAMSSAPQPKVPSVASVQRKTVAKVSPTPGELPAEVRIANGKRMFGDWEANPAILGQIPVRDLRAIARAYGIPGKGTRPELIAAIRRKVSKRPAATPVKRATPAPRQAPPAAPPTTAQRAVTPPRPTTWPIPETTEIVASTPARQAELAAAVVRQTQLAPNSMGKLLRSSEMTPEERAEFRRRFGQDATAGYMTGQYRLVVNPNVFTPRATAALRAEVRTGYSSQIGEVSGLEGAYAHEFGHHLSYLSRVLGAERTRPIWDEIARGAGVPRPLRYDQASLDRWVAEHRDALARAVSRYGATDSGELLAEVWAEFSTNPNAREHIKRAAIALRDLAEETAILL